MFMVTVCYCTIEFMQRNLIVSTLSKNIDNLIK